MKHILSVIAVGFGLLTLASVPARADLKLCNNTPTSVQIAIGYKDKEGWASEGWWTVKPNSCSGILKGALIARYYYLYALDERKVAVWPGKALMCVKDKIFTIRGMDKCQERGYLQQGFYELDTGDKAEWTVNLTADKGGQAAAPASDTPKQP